MKEQKTCWIITEGLIGTDNQCFGVTDALGITPDHFKVTLRQPWKSLSPWLGWENRQSFQSFPEPPWPDLLMTAGRKAVAASRFIKKQSGGQTFTLHLQDPKCDPADFDLVAVPRHDDLRASNVIVTESAPNRLSDTRLKTALKEFSHFGNYPAPRIAVLIGGASKTHNMSDAGLDRLITQLQSLKASLFVTVSRRTEPAHQEKLQAALHDENILFWDGTPPNPYHGMLAWADMILVTADSVSMISDACTTGKPTFMIPMEARKKNGSKRFDRFHQNLINLGCLRHFDGNPTPYSYEPLHDAQKIAHALKSRLGIS